MIFPKIKAVISEFDSLKYAIYIFSRRKGIKQKTPLLAERGFYYENVFLFLNETLYSLTFIGLHFNKVHSRG